MNPRPDNAPWRWLWDYVCLWDDPEDGGLRPEPGENGLLEHDDGPIDEELDGDFDGDGEQGPEDEDEDFDEVPIGEPDDDSPDFAITEPDDVPPAIPGFAITKDGAETSFVREFDSWHEFVTTANDPQLVQWNESNRASQKPDRESWTGTATFADAVDMALRRGWPEGRELLRDSLIAVRPQPKVYESLEFEVAGAFPCVPVYCAGDPAWMISDPGSVVRSAKPIVRIDYNHWVNADVDIKSMMLRGAAIVSLADSLERQGLSVELRIVGNSRDIYGGTNRTFRYSIVYKRAGEPLDLDRAAFAIAHPASMRRLAFAILEQHKELEKSFRGNYGSPLYQANPSISANSSLDALTVLFVPGSRGGETPDSATAAVQKVAEKLLDQLNQKDLAA
jgi:hypothetical protein